MRSASATSISAPIAASTGRLVAGPSVSDLVKAKSPEIDAEVRAKLDATMDAMNAMYLRALTTESYDQMIGEGNDAGNAVVERVIDALLDQTKSIERAVAVLDLKAIEFEGSDSLDSPGKVQAENKAAGEEGGEPELTMGSEIGIRYNITNSKNSKAGGLKT